jgi:hypothetical protein
MTKVIVAESDDPSKSGPAGPTIRQKPAKIGKPFLPRFVDQQLAIRHSMT